jgi:hypothetical protein
MATSLHLYNLLQAPRTWAEAREALRQSRACSAVLEASRNPALPGNDDADGSIPAGTKRPAGQPESALGRRRDIVESSLFVVFTATLFDDRRR